LVHADPIRTRKGVRDLRNLFRQAAHPTPRERKLLEQFARVASVAIEHARSEEALKASEQLARGQVEALTYSLDVLAIASEPEKFLGKMLSTICRLLSAQSTTLWLFDEPPESLVLRPAIDSASLTGVDPDHPLMKKPLSWKENSVIQELFFAAGPVVCEDIEADPRVNDQFRDDFMPKGTKKFLAVPILAGGNVKGMITVSHAERLPYRTSPLRSELIT
jgi:GAF domain-containing protein